MTQPVIDRTADVTAFHENAEWTGVRSDETSRWLGERQTMLTASDVAAVMGEDPDRCAFEVYVDKRVEKVPEKLPPWDPREVGRVLEQPLLENVALYRGWNYRRGGYLLRSRHAPFLGSTLDAEVERGDGVWCPLEGKTTDLIGCWNEDTGEMPTRVLIQVQAQLEVTRADLAIVFALLRHYQPVQIPVYRKPELGQIIVEHARAFLDLVHAQTPPPADGSKSARRALHRLYAAEDGSVVDLPPEAVGWTEEYFELSEKLKELEERKRWLQNQIKACVGAATFGLLPEEVAGKSCWRWKTQPRGSYEVEQSESRVLLALKHPPQGARVGRQPPALPPKKTSLERALEESVDERENVIRIGNKRRRSRR